MHLVLIRGLPGSGKTYFARNSPLFKNFYRVEADDFFTFEVNESETFQDPVYMFDGKMCPEAHAMCKARTDMLMKAGKNVCVANTFTTNEEMRWYVECARHFNAKLTIYHIATQFKSIHNVPQHTLEAMTARWETRVDENVIK